VAAPVETITTHGPVVTTAQTPAGWHVLRSAQIARARASRVAAAAAPARDYPRVLAYIFGKTPETLMPPGAMAEHCGISEQRAREVLASLVDDGLIAPGATSTRLSITGRHTVRDGGEAL